MKNKVGVRVGRLIVVEELERYSNNERKFKCLCDCGNYRIARFTNLFRKSVSQNTSCGCWGKRKRHKTKSTKHYRRLYSVWHAMKKRCYRKEDKHYKHYGALGIRVCKRWHSFGRFYNDMIDCYEPGLSIERIDLDKDYSPGNCTWIPLAEQAKNRRSSLAYREKTGYTWPYAKKT